MPAKAASLIELIRPELPLAAGTCVVAGQLLALGSAPPLGSAALGFLTGFLLSAAAMASNDHFDLEVDRVNHPGRPLPSGRVTSQEVALLTAGLSVAGLLAAAMLGIVPLLLSIVIWSIGMLYNWRCKESGLPGNLMVATSVASTFLLGGAAVGTLNGVVLTFAALAFLFDLGEEIAAGALDREGDALRSARTVARVRGERFALHVSTALFGLFIIIAFVPFLAGWLGASYLLLVVLTAAAMLLLVHRLLASSDDAKKRQAVRWLYLTVTAFTLALIAVRLMEG